jgi:hypothetical protein
LIEVAATGQGVSLGYLAPLAAAFGWQGLPREGNVSLNAKMSIARDEAPILAGTIAVSKIHWAPSATIHTARLDLGPRRIRVSGLVVEAGESTITGSLERAVDSPSVWQADLRVNEVSAAGIAAFFASRQFPPVQAMGKIAAAHLHLRGLLLEDVQSAFTLGGGRLLLRDAQARLAGGRVNGRADLDFAQDTPEYVVQAKLMDAEAGKLAPDLAEGEISGSLSVEASGRTAAGIAASLHLAGRFSAPVFRIREDALAQALGLDHAQAGAVTADVEVRDRLLHFTRMTMAGPPPLEASGTMSFEQLLAMDFQTFRLAGTLSAPQRLAREIASQ